MCISFPFFAISSFLTRCCVCFSSLIFLATNTRDFHFYWSHFPFHSPLCNSVQCRHRPSLFAIIFKQRWGCAAVTLDESKVIVIGGYGGGTVVVASVEVFKCFVTIGNVDSNTSTEASTTIGIHCTQQAAACCTWFLATYIHACPPLWKWVPSHFPSCPLFSRTAISDEHR